MSADRERLIGVIERIAEEAKRRALDPKNVAKGDHWRELSMEDLTAMFDDEANELCQELMPPYFEPNGAGWESGDLLVVMAIMLDKMETGPRYDEERRRGRPLGAFHGVDSPASTDGWPPPRRIGPRGTVAICICSIGTLTRGCVAEAPRCASPASRPGTARNTLNLKPRPKGRGSSCKGGSI